MSAPDRSSHRLLQGAGARRTELRGLITSALLRRVLAVQVVLALIPLTIISIFALQSMRDAQQAVVASSQRDFDAQAFENLKARDVSAAQTVASFLQAREADLQVVATLPRTSQEYVAFGAALRSTIWTVDPSGQEVRVQLPLFQEIAFVDTTGQEQAEAVDACTNYPFDCSMQPATSLTNVSDPANTLYKSETYFQDTVHLPQGGVYVGQPIGFDVPYQNAYAGAQNRAGQRYAGVVRFAMPVYDGQTEAGIVVVSLDSAHLLELVSHIAPSNPLPQAEIDPRDADFTYMVGPTGWTFAHPRAYNIAGVDQNGVPVPSISEADRSDEGNQFRPGDLTQMGFIDSALPDMVIKNQQGAATHGVTLVSSPFSGPERAMAYATIPYTTGQYNTPAGFGLVVMSTDAARFHLGSVLLGRQVDDHVTSVTFQAQIIGAVTAIFAVLLAFVLAVSLARPIVRLTRAAGRIEREDWDHVDLDRLAATKGRDEVAQLTRVFASMSREVRGRLVQLREQVQQLQVVIDDSKRTRDVQQIVESEFFRDLSGKAREMRQKRQNRLDAESTESTPST